MPHPLYYHEKHLHLDEVPLADLAKQLGTPCYVYSQNHISQQFSALKTAFSAHKDTLICFATKANTGVSILKNLSHLGCGFDAVSMGEIRCALAAGARPQHVVFSGVGKSAAEISDAMDQNILCLNAESWNELERIQQIACEKNKVAHVGFRINPDIDPKTHPSISTGLKHAKFGIPIDQAISYYQKAQNMPNVKTISVSCHIGSQIMRADPFSQAAQKIAYLYKQLVALDIPISIINMGGGLGIDYLNQQKALPPEQYAQALLQHLSHLPVKLIIEPGRFLLAQSGVLITQVEYIKHDDTTLDPFAIVNAGMNDLLRPMLYGAKHRILPLQQQTCAQHYQVVGPICESTDVFGRYHLPKLQQEDLLAIADVGAYGFTMSSNYNSKPKPTQALVSNGKIIAQCSQQHWENMMENNL